ncbi:hypothetical protein H1P_330007 [Hyella patelloides LEGE 07179]|uniref:Uncharacterized protein n=1 Tax=Hyella patelloides LEGE 07179 TaxID=945734 RepID=A0A563VV71_9CYAN|nr:hypothetical protein [Hyella patelloides]VEP15358.1 hypothetical protein H1P_330007 [Hyella patelloides LEGE 07179]
MSLILSFLGFLITFLVIYFSSKIEDEVEALVTRLLAVVIFFLSLLFSSLLIKLTMLGIFLVICPFIGDRLSVYFHHQIKK